MLSANVLPRGRSLVVSRTLSLLIEPKYLWDYRDAFLVVMILGVLVFPGMVAAKGVGENEPAVGTTVAENTSGLSSTGRATLKTISFQTAANLSDTIVFGALVGASTQTSIAFLAVNTVSAVAVYFPYELAWNAYGPPPEATTAATVAEKTAIYQAITGVRNLALGYAFSGALLPSASFVVAAFVIDAAVYVANEYVWDVYGPRVRN